MGVFSDKDRLCRGLSGAHIGIGHIMGRRACSKRMKRLLQSGADRAGSRPKMGLLKAAWKLSPPRRRRN
ncbi:hypothetical protein PCAR4_170044 [Paraburkholderia caribensis]|nr:hypothetical protein PCAR4_170044 [Paraburkholderia caribensis]